MASATADLVGTIPLQTWYDSLRETDDGRFSKKISTDIIEKPSLQSKFMRARAQ